LRDQAINKLKNMLWPSPSPEKLVILAVTAKYEVSCASSGTPQRNARAGGLGSTTGMGICHSYTADVRCVPRLKILLTNFCLYDCALGQSQG
jgi:predicted DNA-binding helix-hairpin-helix protein